MDKRYWEGVSMNILGIVKVMWADILQVSVASPFSGAASCEWRRENGCLLTEDLDGCLDCEEYRKAMISYSWLRVGEMTEGMFGNDAFRVVKCRDACKKVQRY